MAEVLGMIYSLNRFIKLWKFSKPIQTLILLLPLALQAQIPEPCLEAWENLPTQADSILQQSFPDFLSCCGTSCEAKKDSLLGRAFHIKAIYQLQQNDLLGAQVTNRKALAIRKKAKPSNPTDIGHSFLNLGIIFSKELSRFQQAKIHLDSAWLYLSRQSNYELRGDCRLEMALLMQKQGDIENSFLLIDQAIKNYEQLPQEAQPFLIANAYLAKGELHAELKNYSKASQAYQESLDIYGQAGDLFEKARVLHNLGHLEMEQRNWGKAFDFFEQGITVYQQLTAQYQNIPEAMDFIQEQRTKSSIGLGSCLIKLGNFVRAEKELVAAMKGTFPHQVNLKASIADNLGDLYLIWGNKNDKAIATLNEGLGFLFPDFSPQDPLDCPMISAKSQILGESDLLLTLVQDKARALVTVASSLQSKKANSYLQSALQHYLLADQLSFRFRQNQQAEASRLFWQQENRTMYEAAIDLCYELNKPDQAFQLMENSKALVLLEALKDAVAKASAGISEADLQAEQQLKGDIAQLQAMMAGLQEGDEKSELQKRLNSLSLQQNELLENFKNRYPQYFTYKYDQWTKEAKEIRQTLGEAALIEFFEGKKATYICYLSLDTIRMAKVLPTAKETESFIETLKNPLLSKDMVIEAYALYEMLFDPFLGISFPEKLYIVPDGQLTRLPFDALCSAPVLEEGKIPFLLHSHHISYAYSASVLFQESLEAQSSAKKLLAIAPGTFESLQLSELEHSQAEAQSIARTMGGKAILGEAATKAAFLANSNDYLLLHLSTHAAADSISSPWIAFKDSFLYLPAIYGLETQARLVVLSACQTSQGKLAHGEGVMSLARAFRYAGVPSVLASMWEAEDASAKYIMEAFYEKLKAGLPKDQALSEAKRAYLEDAAHFSFRSPFFWSNFVLVGDVGELGKWSELGKLEKLGKNEVKLLIGLFFTLIVYFYFRTQNRRKYAQNK